MASRSSYSVLRSVHQLINLGVVGGMTDAQLLAIFVRRQDEAAEAAFEVLMFRHGPMVYRVCRSLLRDTNDAEDAFQAVFRKATCQRRNVTTRQHSTMRSAGYPTNFADP
jgi:hypothetical protein